MAYGENEFMSCAFYYRTLRCAKYQSILDCTATVIQDGEVRIKRKKKQKLPSLRYWHVFNIKHHHCWHLMCVSHCFAADDNKYTNANIAPDKFLSFHHFVAPMIQHRKILKNTHIIPSLDSPFYSNRCEMNIHIFVCTCVSFHTYK